MAPEPSGSTPLLSDVDIPGHEGRSVTNKDAVISNAGTNGEAFDDVPHEKRQIGVLSAISLIFNRMVGTGIYATPSLILRASGSVGMFLVMWIVGALVAAAGMAVYVEFGVGLPRSGGEKNYLEHVYRRPKLLVTCCITAYFCLLGWSATNAVAFGEYMIHAFGGNIRQWNTRLLGLACLTFATLLHAFRLNWGLRLQNILAIMKLTTLVFIIMLGMLVSLGQFPLDDKPRNFDHIWEGTSNDPNAFVSGLYNVIWAFVGYSNAHYALSETREPVRIIKRAAPLAMALITAMYLLTNLAYLAVVDKDDIRSGGRVVAAYFFRNLFGPAAERVLSAVISISILGNVLAVTFAQSRVIQELGREGIIPWSAVVASNAPYNTPFAALLFAWVMSTFWMMAPPPGDAYNFVLNLHSYPYALINVAVSGGLLWLYVSPSERSDWDPSYRAGIPVVIWFLVSNIFLAVAPIIPPAPGFVLYLHLPYWLHVAACIGILCVGVIYWFILTRLLPTRGGYKLVRDTLIQEDGVSRSVLRKVWT